MFAVVALGGKQYKVQEGDIIYVEKIDKSENETVELDQVLALSKDTEFITGNPTVPGASVLANIVKQGKAKKIYVMTYKPKKNEKRKQGHRQPFTKLQITTIKA